jgi:hypothetical protein
MKHVGIEVSPATLPADLTAALDTYGVEISLPANLQPSTHRVFLRVPLSYVQHWTGPGGKGLFGTDPVEAIEGPPDSRTDPELYPSLCVKLVESPATPRDIFTRQMPDEYYNTETVTINRTPFTIERKRPEQPPEKKTRWPFFVDAEMILIIDIDGHKWVTTFHPCANPNAAPKNQRRRTYEEIECLRLSLSE